MCKKCDITQITSLTDEIKQLTINIEQVEDKLSKCKKMIDECDIILDKLNDFLIKYLEKIQINDTSFASDYFFEFRDELNIIYENLNSIKLKLDNIMANFESLKLTKESLKNELNSNLCQKCLQKQLSSDEILTV